MIATEPGRDVDPLGIAFPLPVGPRDCKKLLGVRSRPLSELARQAREAARVLHVEQQLGAAVGVGSDDHLFGGVGVMVEVHGALRPTGVAYTHLEATSIERAEFVDLAQLVDLGAELLGQVEVVRRQLVLGVASAADVAVAARDASATPWPDSAEVRIVGVDSRAPEVHTNRRRVERLASPDVDRGLMEVPIDVGRHVRIADDTEHPAWPGRDAAPVRRPSR